MIITCPECGTKFSIADDVLGERGRKVRCFKCGATWHQMPEGAETTSMPPLAAEPMEPPPQAVRPPAPPLMPPTPTVDESGLPLESEPRVEDAPLPVPEPLPGLPMDSETIEPSPVPDVEIPKEDEDLKDPEAFAPMPAGGPIGSNTVDVDDLLGSSAEDIHKVLAKRVVQEKESGGWGKVLFLLVVLAAVGAGLWFGRIQVVQRVPAAARIYKALGLPVEVLGQGLEFRSVTSEMVKDGSTPVLQVRGVIVNIVDKDCPVPLLRLALFDTNGGVVQQTFAKARKEFLAGGTQIGFQIRVENPSSAAVRYEVTFAEPPASGQPSGTANPPAPPPVSSPAKP